MPLRRCLWPSRCRRSPFWCCLRWSSSRRRAAGGARAAEQPESDRAPKRREALTELQDLIVGRKVEENHDDQRDHDDREGSVATESITPREREHPPDEEDDHDRAGERRV